MRATLPALLLLALGCAPEPEDPIYMHATAFGSDGAPLADSVLLLERSKAYRWDGLEPFAELTTDASGAFGHEFEHRDLMRGDATSSAFRVRRPLQQGAGAVLDFTYYGRADFRLPPFREVQVATQLDASTVSFTRPHVDEGERSIDVVELHAGEQLAWREVTTTERFTFEPFQAEDFVQLSARVRATASAELVFKSLLLDMWASVSYTRSVVSQAHVLPLEPFIPPSRGASCSFPLQEMGPCPLTDGKLDKVELVDGYRTGVQEIRIVLDEPRIVRRLVLRGVNDHYGTQIVQTSSNGTQWKEAARFNLYELSLRAIGPAYYLLDETFTAIPLANEEAIRHLRLVPEDAVYGSPPPFAREISLLE